MKTPLIGLTPMYDKEKESLWMSRDYIKAVFSSGGIPFILPLVSESADLERLAETFDGFLFTGGGDVMPHLYGEELLEECGEQCPQRDEFELALAKIAFERRIPVFAICRGIQALNAAFGGTLFQDIPKTTVVHDQTGRLDRAWPAHSVEIETNSLLYKILGEKKITVNSFHHQAVKNLAPGFTANAKALDSLIEGMEFSGDWFALCVQWHPENMAFRDENAKKLFDAFIEKCRGE
ncbi:MAG: gamma-glutamyl-gamma-aminobutyrate hydrolase family protein [Oscillospiraceae bacterium]|jgi:putative glutamine amidotransferase|nr:gamma-glutamyl-gamma-aminobutyrate hydrolase family protein [Oscillospiraceae bacterium]